MVFLDRDWGTEVRDIRKSSKIEKKGFQECGEEGRHPEMIGSRSRGSSVLLLCCGRGEAVYELLGYGTHLLEPVSEGLRNHQGDLHLRNLCFNNSVEAVTQNSKLRIPESVDWIWSLALALISCVMFCKFLDLASALCPSL